jgi:hypothetical protein
MLLTPEDTSDHPGVPREKRLDKKADEEGENDRQERKAKAPELPGLSYVWE